MIQFHLGVALAKITDNQRSDFDVVSINLETKIWVDNVLERFRFIVIGRANMDLYAMPTGASIEGAESFHPDLGGSGANIAAGIARLGGDVHLLSALRDDGVGAFIMNALARYKIGREFVSFVIAGAQNPLAFAENRVKDHKVVLYRASASDIYLDVPMVEKVAFSDRDYLIVTGTALSQSPSREATLFAMKAARANNARVVIDLDYRENAWENKDIAKTVYMKACDFADIIIGNDVEFGVMSGAIDTGQALAEEMGKTRLVIYKMGQDGAYSYQDGRSEYHGVFSVEALKPIGAGDAFMAAFITAHAEAAPLNDAVARGAANAAIVVSRPHCAPAMAYRQELEDFIATHEQSQNR